MAQVRVVTLELTVDELNFVLAVLGELPSRVGAWPLAVKIGQQAEAQLAVVDAGTDTPVDTEQIPPLAQARSRLYRFSDYNEHYCLHLGGWLMATMAWLSHSFLLPFMAAAFGSGKEGNMNYILEAEQHPLLFLSCSAPALMVAIAWMNRVPRAGHLTRYVWRHGRGLLLLAALMDAGARLWPGIYVENALTGCSLALDAGAFLYVLVSHRVADVFADFPPLETA